MAQHQTRLLYGVDSAPARKQRRRVSFCHHCGSVLVISSWASAKTKLDFCDIECANAFKSFAYIDLSSKRQQSLINGPAKLVCIDPLCDNEVPYRGRCQDCREMWDAWNKEANRNLAALLYAGQSIELSAVCKECDQQFIYTRHKDKAKRKQKFCSEKCMNKNLKRNREHRVRAIRARGERIGLGSLMRKYHGRCAFCNTECVKPDGSNADNEATVDHVIPLSKGGTHTKNNVQLLCRRCNTVKSDNISDGGQLQLIFTPDCV